MTECIVTHLPGEPGLASQSRHGHRNVGGCAPRELPEFVQFQAVDGYTADAQKVNESLSEAYDPAQAITRASCGNGCRLCAPRQAHHVMWE
jgi:hypothetical protein